MLDIDAVVGGLAIAIAGAPLALVAVLGSASLVGRPLAERTISRLVGATIIVGLAASLVMLAVTISSRRFHVTVEIGNWVVIPSSHFSFKLLFDFLSMPFVILIFVLCGTISAFGAKYLHREPGYNRFFTLFALFVFGMVLSALAGTIETLFTGWELVGLSSALLVAFFQERAMPVANGLRIWTIYRVADAAFLIAAVVLHHLRGAGDFDAMLGAGPWPAGHASLTSSQALIVGLLLLVAAAGKSALVPFSGWLPRAMEGPTPSSAVFYGALSVHLGAYLLLRVGPIIELSLWLSAAVVLMGLVTALFAAIAARVQTDIKSALSYASLTQVGLIVAEIGLGLRWIPLAHILGHACLRTLQFVRAPTLLHDYHHLENAIGSHLPRRSHWPNAMVAENVGVLLYRFAMERCYMDALLSDYVGRPFVRLFRWCDAMERRWTDFLSGGRSRESDQLGPSAGSLEELA